MATLIDLSHTVEHGLITYKGLPAPIVCDFLSREESRRIYAPGTEFQIGKIEMVANTGTYVDSPFHRYADGKDLSELPLESLVDLDGIVVRHAGRAIGRSAFGSQYGPLCGLAVSPVRRWEGPLRTAAGVARGPGWHRGAACRAGDRPLRIRRFGSARQGCAGTHRLGPALGNGTILRRSSVPDSGGGAAYRRLRSRAGGHRFAEYRRYRRPVAAGAVDRAARRYSHRRAPVQPGGAAGGRVPILRGAGEGEAVRQFPGTGVCDCDRLKPVLPFPGDAQRTPLAVLVVFGKQHDLSHVARVVRDLAADGLHHGVGFAADRDAAAEVRVRQRPERAEHAIPAGLPKLHESLAGGRRLLELGVAMAVRLLSIGGQEVRPARAHVAGHVLDNDGNRICFGVERGEKLLVGDLRHSGVGELLVLAQQGQRFFQV